MKTLQPAVTQRTNTMRTPTLPFTFHPLAMLDNVAQVLAFAASKVSRVAGAGVRWEPVGPAFIDAWREATAWTLRAGRLEFVVDLRVSA